MPVPGVMDETSQNEQGKHFECHGDLKDRKRLKGKKDASVMTLTPVGYNVTENISLNQAMLVRNEDLHNDNRLQDQVIFWALLDGFLFVAIVSGNVLTIAAIFINRRISHVVSNQFILSLACSDLLVGLMLPYHMMFYIEPVLGEYFGLCITRLALVSLACTASVMNIIGIAIDRFLAIVYPLHYNKFLTKRLARFFMSLGWIVAISLAMMPIFWNRWEENSLKKETKGKCEFGYVVVPLFVMTIYLPIFFLLFTIMCGFYVKIFSEARKHAKRMRETNQYTNNPPDTWKSVQVLMLVMGSFTVSYMPFIIIVILNSILQYKTKTTSLVYKVCNSLAMANSAVNPLIYAWKNQEFKKTFWKIIHCKAVNAGSMENVSELRERRIVNSDRDKTNSVTSDSKPPSTIFEKL